jgi:hypothetical protein
MARRADRNMTHETGLMIGHISLLISEGESQCGHGLRPLQVKCGLRHEATPVLEQVGKGRNPLATRMTGTSHARSRSVGVVALLQGSIGKALMARVIWAMTGPEIWRPGRGEQTECEI